jgi:hypothetical protein
MRLVEKMGFISYGLTPIKQCRKTMTKTENQQ